MQKISTRTRTKLGIKKVVIQLNENEERFQYNLTRHRQRQAWGNRARCAYRTSRQEKCVLIAHKTRTLLIHTCSKRAFEVAGNRGLCDPVIKKG
jgi:hypothetical protein